MIHVSLVKLFAIFYTVTTCLLTTIKTYGHPFDKKPPNLVIIISDDQGHDDFGALNPKIFNTPRLDALRQDSVVFENFYVNSTCAPTRASLLTGRRFLETGVWGVHGGQDYLNLDEQTFAQALAKSGGYSTAFFGKWHSGKTQGYLPWDRGFDTAVMARLYQHLNGQLYTKNGPSKASGWTDTVLAKRVAEYITKHASAEKPFCLLFAPMAPHGSWRAPENLIKKFSAKGFSKSLATLAAMLEALDSNVGIVLDAIEHSGIAENTVVFYLSDNGPINESGRKDLPALTDTEWNLRNPSKLKGNKARVWENGIRVPLFVRWTNKIHPRHEATPTHVIDIFPSLCELAGLGSAPRDNGLDIHGFSLTPLLKDQIPIPARSLFIANDHVQDQNGRQRYDLLKSIDNLPASRQHLTLRSGPYKLIRSGERAQLFNIQKDPQETCNLAAVEPERFAVLNAQTQEAFLKARDSGRAYQMPVFQIGGNYHTSLVHCAAPARLRGSASYDSHAVKNLKGPDAGVSFNINVTMTGLYDIFLHANGVMPNTTVRLAADRAQLSTTINQAQLIPLGSLHLNAGKQLLDFDITKNTHAHATGIASLKAISFVASSAEATKMPLHF